MLSPEVAWANQMQGSVTSCLYLTIALLQFQDTTDSNLTFARNNDINYNKNIKNNKNLSATIYENDHEKWN